MSGHTAGPWKVSKSVMKRNDFINPMIECEELLGALKDIYDYSAKQFDANSDERALWAQVNKKAANAIAKATEGRE